MKHVLQMMRTFELNRAHHHILTAFETADASSNMRLDLPTRGAYPRKILRPPALCDGFPRLDLAKQLLGIRPAKFFRSH